MTKTTTTKTTKTKRETMTTTSEGGNDNASRVASEILEDRKAAGETPPPRKSGGGRPNKSGKVWPKKKSRAGRVARAEKPADVETSEPTEADIAAYSQLGGFAWKAASNLWGLEALTDDETTQLGTALAQVGNKYAPMLGPYMPEFNLAVVVVGLVMSKRAPKKKHAEEEEDFPLGLGRDGLPGA
jgi:hypothetical protein